MKIKVTGDYRDVANSAWISTVKEIRAYSRTDEDALRVVRFLVEHHHTSPFESVTITLTCSESENVYSYARDNYCRIGTNGTSISIDLLNFIKITMTENLFDEEPWQLFTKERPELAEMCSKFTPLGGKILTIDDVPGTLGNHGMAVELISFHDTGERSLSRATWRVKCPLSIAVQILRHRKGSYNMVSGRYKTIRQEVVPPVDDCSELFEKIGSDLNRYMGSVDPVILQYNSVMKKAQVAKKLGNISNDEYKRLREFARFVLPEGRMTELYITYYLDDFYDNYVLLRDSKHAQTEHVWIAQEMQRVLVAK